MTRRRVRAEAFSVGVDCRAESSAVSCAPVLIANVVLALAAFCAWLAAAPNSPTTTTADIRFIMPTRFSGLFR